MNFQERLDSMRAKPQHVRKRYAFWSSLGVTAIIAVFWIASFTAFGTRTDGAVAQAVENAGTPGSTLVASVGTFFTDITDMIFGSKKVTYSNIEVTPGNN